MTRSERIEVAAREVVRAWDATNTMDEYEDAIDKAEAELRDALSSPSDRSGEGRTDTARAAEGIDGIGCPACGSGIVLSTCDNPACGETWIGRRSGAALDKRHSEGRCPPGACMRCSAAAPSPLREAPPERPCSRCRKPLPPGHITWCPDCVDKEMTRG